MLREIASPSRCRRRTGVGRLGRKQKHFRFLEGLRNAISWVWIHSTSLFHLLRKLTIRVCTLGCKSKTVDELKFMGKDCSNTNQHTLCHRAMGCGLSPDFTVASASRHYVESQTSQNTFQMFPLPCEPSSHIVYYYDHYQCYNSFAFFAGIKRSSNFSYF